VPSEATADSLKATDFLQRLHARAHRQQDSIQLTVDIYGHLVPGANKAAADRLLSPLQSATQAQPVAAQA